MGKKMVKELPVILIDNKNISMRIYLKYQLGKHLIQMKIEITTEGRNVAERLIGAD